MTDLPQISPLPGPPQRGQDPALFIQLADAFIDALPQFRAELNAFGAQLVAATIERVVNEAAVSFEGAEHARDAAIVARDAAQQYAASIAPSTFVKLVGDQNIDGGKTFAQKIVASLGIRINNVDLTALTAAGKALIEAVDAAAQRNALGIPMVLVQDFDTSGTWTKAAGAKAVQVILWGGGGGGGGGVPANGQIGSGGAGGGYSTGILSAADVPANVSVTIGAGGVGSGGGVAGGTGGTTSFGALLAARGGPGGNVGSGTIYGSGALFAGGFGGVGASNPQPGGNVHSYNNEGSPTPCPGGGGGGYQNSGGAAGGAGSLRGVASNSGGGGAGGGVGAGSAGAGRNGIIPGTAGGGGSGRNAADGAGGAGGSGAGGGGGGCGVNDGQAGAVGGPGGSGFCRVVTYF